MDKKKHEEIFLYGLGGAEKSFRPLMYEKIEKEDISINTLRNVASIIKSSVPNVMEVYAIDTYYGLFPDYMKTRKGDIEACAIFKDLLQRNGLRIM